MSNVRWESPFPYTLAFNLFKKHLEEINRSYWAFVPAANTIKALANQELVDKTADPKNFLKFQMRRIDELLLHMKSGKIIFQSL